MRITIIHGFNATPQDHFYPWLADTLRAKGYEVQVPELPLKTGEELEAEALLKLMNEKIGLLTHDDIVVGHSLSAVLALRYLEYVEMKSTSRAFVLVAPPWKVGAEEMQSLFMTNLDFDVVPWKAMEFVVVHSPDDDLVPFDHAKKWSEVLKAKLVDIPGNDHYMDKEYPILVDVIENLKHHPIEYEPGSSLPDAYKGVR